MSKKRGFIFDLDGVIVDTAKYHYLAWKELAKELGFDFKQEHNERLKGVSRMTSLEIVLEVGNKTSFSEEEKEALATKKNEIYLSMIEGINRDHILPGIPEFLEKIKADGCLVALGSASKSGDMILEKLGILPLFDVVVDGKMVEKAKPNPEVFTMAAKLLGLPETSCIVVEDAKAGIEAAKAANMSCIGIGTMEQLSKADIVLGSTDLLKEVDYLPLFR